MATPFKISQGSLLENWFKVHWFPLVHVILNRIAKCDVTKIKICELMGFVEIIQEIKTKNVSLPKISMLEQIVGKKLPQFALMTPYKSF